MWKDQGYVYISQRRENKLKIYIDGHEVEQVKQFNYLGVINAYEYYMNLYSHLSCSKQE